MRHVPCAPRARDRKPSDQALLDAVGERAHQLQKLRGSATRVGGRRWDELYGEAAAGAEPSSILLTEAGAKTYELSVTIGVAGDAVPDECPQTATSAVIWGCLYFSWPQLCGCASVCTWCDGGTINTPAAGLTTAPRHNATSSAAAVATAPVAAADAGTASMRSRTPYTAVAAASERCSSRRQ